MACAALPCPIPALPYPCSLSCVHHRSLHTACQVDGAAVTSEDLGNNFFVDPSFLGQPRAEAVAALLAEMNPDDCQGASRVADPAALIATEPPAFFRGFSLVLATQLAEAPLQALSQVARGTAPRQPWKRKPSSVPREESGGAGGAGVRGSSDSSADSRCE